MNDEIRHCDDYIDDKTQPAALRAFLSRAREPAHGHMNPAPFPTLFADFGGTRYRVVMASRMGDVGITSKLDRDHGYEMRVAVQQLTNFSETP